MDDEKIISKIKQRRLQMIVHSCIYYVLNDNVVSDDTWSRWAKELEELQEKYPELSKKAPYSEYFDNWDGSTGFDLPIREPWVVEKAEWLLSIRGGNQ